MIHLEVMHTSHFMPSKEQFWIWTSLWGVSCVLPALKRQGTLFSFLCNYCSDQCGGFSLCIVCLEEMSQNSQNRDSSHVLTAKERLIKTLLWRSPYNIWLLLDCFQVSMNAAFMLLFSFAYSEHVFVWHCREFGRWKVNSLALERQENNGFSLPLDPEFLQTIRQLGRRPSLSAITDNIIRKYGTHFLLSATLGGK